MSARLSSESRRGTEGARDPTVRSRMGRSVGHVQFRRPTAVELLGVVGVGVGFWLLAGVAGVVVAVAVALLWYGFSGVYGFAAGQFLFVAALPARVSLDLVTPELVGLQAALVLVLVGDDHRGGGAWWVRRFGRTVALAVVLTTVALAVGIRSAAIADETLVVVAIGGTFVLLTVGVSAVGRLLVSPVVDEATAAANDVGAADADRTEPTG